MFIMQPAFSIEEIVESRSSNMTDFADYTGETFFKSRFELEEERNQLLQVQKKQYYQQFRPSNWQGRLAFHRNKTMPPFKIIRLKIVNVKNNLQMKFAKKQNSNTQISADTDTDEESALDEQNNSETQIKDNAISTSDNEDNSVLQEEAQDIQVMVKCRTMKYLPETNEMEAIGSVELKFPTQNTVMYSDRMTYNNMTGIVQLYDNVKVIRNGQELYGDYIKVDLNEEMSQITNPKAQYAMSLDFEAENGYVFGDTIIAEKGKITSESDDIIYTRSSGFGEAMSRFIMPDEDLAFLINDVDNNKYMVKVNELKITAKASHDKIQLKNPKIYSNKTGKKIFSLPSLTFYTNKEKDYFEGNYPELGSLAAFGMYLGPGAVLETPFGSTLKLMPTINYKNKFGFGGLARFTSATNNTEFAYNTAANMFILRGVQRLDDHLFLQYGKNSYMDDWFLGKYWLGYGGDLVYEKGYTHNDFLYKNANASFRHRISAGIFHENDRNQSGNKYRRYSNMSTARFKYMAEYNQRLYSMFGGVDTTYYDGWKQVDFSVIAQGSAALYGTGDTQFVGRLGPRLSTQYKNWRQEAGYYLTCYDDNTPLTRFDAYRYGRSNVYLREYIRLHKYLTLGFYVSYLLKDTIRKTERDLLREATFYAAIGPDDFKLNLGYDWVRKNTYFGVSMAMNTKGSSVEYKKMTIKNPDKIGKTDGPKNEVERYEFVPPPNPYRSHVGIVDIDDTSKYMEGEPL